jgi:hypothetical protein
MDKPKVYIWNGELFWACEYEVIKEDGDDAEPLYTAPREWVGLTDEEAAECWSTSAVQTWKHIEAKLKEKNT